MGGVRCAEGEVGATVGARLVKSLVAAREGINWFFAGVWPTDLDLNGADSECPQVGIDVPHTDEAGFAVGGWPWQRDNALPFAVWQVLPRDVIIPKYLRCVLSGEGQAESFLGFVISGAGLSNVFFETLDILFPLIDLELLSL